MPYPTAARAAPDSENEKTPNDGHRGRAEPVSIAFFSRIMEVVLAAVLVLVPLGLCLLVIYFPEFVDTNEMLGGLKVTPGPLSLPWMLAAMAVLLLTAAPLLYAVNAARHMFRRFRSGAIFTPETARHVRQIALGLLVQAVAGPIGGMALSGVLSAAGKAQSMVLSFGSDQIFLALFAFIFLGLARVMRAAALLAEDNAAIV